MQIQYRMNIYHSQPIGYKMDATKKNKNVRSHRVNIRLFDDDAEVLEEMAKYKGVPPTTLAYILLKDAINQYKSNSQATKL